MFNMFCSRVNIFKVLRYYVDAKDKIVINYLYLIIGYTPLVYSCARGHFRVVQTLLYLKADTEYLTKTGHTPLMVAAYYGRTAIVEILLKYGAQVNAFTTEYKETALIFACLKGHTEVVQLLLKFYADTVYTNHFLIIFI